MTLPAPFVPGLLNLLQLSDFLQGNTVTVRQLDVGQGGNYRSILRRVKLSEDTNIVIDCSIDVLPEVLKQAQQVGLMTDFHKFIITTPDLHTLDLEPYQYSGSNITGIRMINPEDPRVQQITRHWHTQWRTHYETKGHKFPAGKGALLSNHYHNTNKLQ